MSLAIGVTCGERLREEYRRALEAHGARVVEIAPTSPLGRTAPLDPAAALAGVHGLLLSGGGDIAPALYGDSAVDPTVSTEAGRDDMEIALVHAALRRQMPLLGICRGIQLLNVAAGGTLWQDIPSQCPQALRHMDDGHGRERRRLLHSVEVAPTSAAAGLLGGGALPVNSIHHQAVRRVAPGLRVAAMAPDGIVEAIEVPGHPFAMAVQWHPEDLWIQDRRQAALFAGFCDAARAAVSPT